MQILMLVIKMCVWGGGGTSKMLSLIVFNFFPQSGNWSFFGFIHE